MQVAQASRLSNVRYDIRGPVLRRARQLEAAGHEIIKLNLGNPAPFGLDAPDDVLNDVVKHIPTRRATATPAASSPPGRPSRSSSTGAASPGSRPTTSTSATGSPSSSSCHLQALLDTGDEVLVPSPDYPLWTGAINLCGGYAVHYRCDERNDWNPDLEHVASRITERTKALVIINPNNPTGAVYSRETMLGLLDLARQHGLLVLTDEIYDQIIYDGAGAPLGGGAGS